MSSAITAVVVGGAISSSQASKARSAQASATASQLAVEQEQFALTRADTAPYREAGGRALGQLEQMMSGDYDVSQTAGYQFRLDEGYKGVERSQIGQRLSGRAAKEMARYGQDYASAEYGAEFDRLSQMANYGVGGVAQATAAGSASAARTSDIYGAQGEFGVEMAQAESKSYQDTISNLWTAYNDPTTNPFGE